MNASRNANGRAAPASAPPAGAFKITARTGAMAAADSATQFRTVRMPFASCGLRSSASAAGGSVAAICRILTRESWPLRTAGRLGQGCLTTAVPSRQRSRGGLP